MTGSFITDKANGSLDMSLENENELVMIAKDRQATVELRFVDLQDLLDYEQLVAQLRFKWQRSLMLKHATPETQIIHLKPQTNDQTE